VVLDVDELDRVEFGVDRSFLSPKIVISIGLLLGSLPKYSKESKTIK
jgi:hypothetical protein